MLEAGNQLERRTSSRRRRCFRRSFLNKHLHTSLPPRPLQFVCFVVVLLSGTEAVAQNACPENSTFQRREYSGNVIRTVCRCNRGFAAGAGGICQFNLQELS